MTMRLGLTKTSASDQPRYPERITSANKPHSISRETAKSGSSVSHKVIVECRCENSHDSERRLSFLRQLGDDEIIASADAAIQLGGG
jgi:hypothetical protein